MTQILGTRIQTFTGGSFDIAAPSAADVDIRDIAHALAHQCRFSGHCREFYSVAEHCVVSTHVDEIVHSLTRQQTMLMHDAAEAYLQDMPSPIKQLFPQYAEAERRVMAAIVERFGFRWPMTSVEKTADARMLFTEKRDLLEPRDWGWQVEPYGFEIDPWTPAYAESRFLDRFHQLFPEGTDVLDAPKATR